VAVPDDPIERKFVSRGGFKLLAALRAFDVDVRGFICADLGCSTGGFTDCLLQHGASRVYSVDTGYGVLDWTLRKNPRVVVMERTNALHVQLPEPVDLISIDAGWTKQDKILPHALKLLKPGGRIITLIKPHYEAQPAQLRKGILPAELVPMIVDSVLAQVEQRGMSVDARIESPIKGQKGNAEVLALVIPRASATI
jgi:23S rRNA (cytidine1920-2'-O)/16S rRNA (cytidine1409-2'-O)-methyltransferase